MLSLKNYGLSFILYAMPVVFATNYFSYYYLESYELFPEFTFHSIALSVLLFFLFTYHLAARHELKAGIDLLDIFVLLYIVYYLGRLIFSPERSVYDDAFLIQVLGATQYFLIKKVILNAQATHSRHTNRAVILVLALIFVQVIIGILQYIHVFPTISNLFKIEGTLANPGVYGNFLAMVLPVPFFIILFKPMRKSFMYASIILSAFILFALTLSFARTAWLASIAGIAYMLNEKLEITAWMKKQMNHPKHLIIIPLALTMVAFSGYHLYTMKKDSADGRLYIWKNCIELIREKPVFGHGTDYFKPAYNNLQVAKFSKEASNPRHAELADEATFAFNELLQTGVETGIAGILFFTGLILFPFLLKNRNSQTQYKSLTIVGKAGIIAFAICSLLSYPLQNYTTQTLFWSFLAFASFNKNSLWSFALGKISTVVILLSGILLSILSFHRYWTIYQHTKTWSKAIKLSEKGSQVYAGQLFEETYEVLKHKKEYLYTLSKHLLSTGKYEASNELLMKVQTKYNNKDVHLMQAINHENLGNYKEAENHYIQATLLIPTLMAPKYLLAKFYIKENQMEKAQALASEIIDMDMKTYNPKGAEIKTEMLKLIKNHKK